MNLGYSLEYLLTRLLMLVFRLLPLSACYSLASGFGYLSYLLLRSRKKLVLANLQRAFKQEYSQRQIQSLARQIFMQTAVAVSELFWVDKILPQAAERIQFKGLEHTEQAFAQKRGVILVMAHLGSWEYLSFLAFLQKYPSYSIVKAIKNPYLNREVENLRKKIALNPIHKKNSAKRALKELRSNHLVAILIDQWAGPDGIWIDFFGDKTSTTSIPARLAMKTGAALIPAFCIRKKPGFYEIELHPEVPLTGTGPDQELNTTIELNRFLESQIRRYPQQWLWGHRRWKPLPRIIREIPKEASEEILRSDDLTPS